MEKKIHIANQSPRALDVSIEPEGHCFSLAEGSSMEIRYHDDVGDLDLEFVYRERDVTIWCTADKQIWIDGVLTRDY